MKIGKRILKNQSKKKSCHSYIFCLTKKKLASIIQWRQQSMMTTDIGILATKMMAPTVNSKEKQKTKMVPPGKKQNDSGQSLFAKNDKTNDVI